MPIFVATSNVGASGLHGRRLSMHAPHRVLSWVRIHHVGPAERVLHPETKTSPAVAILQISCSNSMTTLYFGLPHPLTHNLANPPKNIFLGRLTMCLTHRMRVLLSVTGICSMSHLAVTSPLLSFCHHFTHIACAESPCEWH